ncbi:unnamed protein product [Phytophthora fragariaefolia]|uniref:Unnamed protein product n=1 Tax=Phytophthora fragariaefolia TaxID=1490495 RepID=A0A9W6XE75_9STRA|nr:unnamed protein product [Phytophthora fragariaefolia]
MVVASSTNDASGTPSGGGSAAPSASPNSETQGRAPTPPSKPSRSASGNSPPDTDFGKTAGPQVISVDRATALQTLGLLSSEQGSSSGLPVVMEIPPGDPSDITARIVGVPATETHNDGRTFLQDIFGGPEALVQMESLGSTELAVLYDFFDENDVIGDFKAPLTATELSSQLKNFAVKREFASILSQFDSKQLALRTFGTVPLLRKVPPEWETVITVMANINLVFQAPPFVGMDPPQDEDDEKTKDGDYPALEVFWICPGARLRPSSGPSRPSWASGRLVLSLRSPKRNRLQMEFKNSQASGWARRHPAVRRRYLCRFPCSSSGKSGELTSCLEGPSSGRQVPDGRQAGSPVDTSRWLRWLWKVSDRREPTFRRASHPGPSLDDGEIDLLDSEDEVEDKAEKDEDYNSHQDLDGGVDNEDEDPDEASDDGVLNVAQHTTKCHRLSKSSVEAPTSKKVKAKSPVKTKVKAGLLTGPSQGSDRRRNPNRSVEVPDAGTQAPPLLMRSRPPSIWILRRVWSLRLQVSASRHGCLPGDAALDEVVRYRAYGSFLPSPGGLGARSGPGVGGLDRLHGGERESTLARDSLIVLDRNSSSKFIRKTCARHLKLQESVRKKVMAREKQLKKIAPASVWNEPGLWNFPSYTKPGTNANYSLKEQVELLDAHEPAHLQWGACSPVEERIAHLPEDVRRKLIPSDQHDYLDD